MAGTTPRRVGRPLLSQYWRDGLLLHWPVRARAVAGPMPPGVVPDVCDGTSRVGPVAFGMERPEPGSGRGLPFFGTFPEVNVRLFSVDGQGRRGVVFRSLNCPRLAAVPAARAAFGLPCRWSDTRWTAENGAPHLASRVRGPAPGQPSTGPRGRPGRPPAPRRRRPEARTTGPAGRPPHCAVGSAHPDARPHGWFDDLDADAVTARCLSLVLAGVRDHGWVHHIPRLMVLGN